jgi:hypothetical protein
MEAGVLMKTIADMVADVIPCPEALPCEDATACLTCDHPLCPTHSKNADEFNECSDGGLHCDGCQHSCKTCIGDSVFDDYEDRFEQSWRGEN